MMCVVPVVIGHCSPNAPTSVGENGVPDLGAGPGTLVRLVTQPHYRIIYMDLDYRFQYDLILRIACDNPTSP